MITYTHTSTDYGPILIASQNDKICGLAFCKEENCLNTLQDLFGKKASFKRDDTKLKPLVQKVLTHSINPTDLSLEGTPFQTKVWQALLKIPEGETRTYTDIAQAIGTPKAVRAVGTAIGQNKISLLIPCHRVLRKGGDLGGYRWGVSIKKKLLNLEQTVH